MTGSTARFRALSGSTNRTVNVTPGGYLYASEDEAEGWTETAIDPTGEYDLGTGTTPGPWVELDGLTIAVPEDITNGQRVDIIGLIRATNKTSNRDGTIAIGFGVNGVDPEDPNFIISAIPRGFDGYLAESITSTNLTVPAGAEISVFARINTGSQSQFGVDLDATAADPHELVVSRVIDTVDILNTFRELYSDSGTTIGSLSSDIQGTRAVDTITTSVTLTNKQYTILANATSGSIVATLTAAKNAKRYVIKKIDTTSNTVTISASNGQTIDGNDCITIDTAWESFDIVSDGLNWFIT